MKQMLNTLYILTPDSYLHLQNEAISVKVGGVEKVRVPAHTISIIYCFGNVTVSTPLISFCGEHGIGLVFLSETGKFYGRVEGPRHGNIILRRMQFSALDDFTLGNRIVRGFLLGKLINSKEFLMRARRERKEQSEIFTAAIGKISSAAEELKECISIESMRGIEGAAAAAYYSAMPAMLKSESMIFQGRNRRPPEDPINALLSFLYTLLKNDFQSALEGVGLDPAAGFLHTIRPGRPALALDMMEELRAPVCDRLAVSLINRGQISLKHFSQLTPPVYLNADGRKIVIQAWQARKQETIIHPFIQEEVPIGLIPHIQAALLARVIRNELDMYPPFHWR